MTGHKWPFGVGITGMNNTDFSQHAAGQPNGMLSPADSESLGDPMDIEGAAKLLGCSVWTVRQRYLPQGLPHLRASATGKFVFFREQVISWILKRQGKGGVK